MRIRSDARRTRTAFTLIELLVVVAIIALLISILLPSLARAREQAYQVKCSANLSGIFKGIYYYVEDKRNGNGYLPQLSYFVAEQVANAGYPGAIWFHQILPYIDVKRSRAGTREGLFRCPADEAPAYRHVDSSSRPTSIGMRVLDDPIGAKADGDRGWSAGQVGRNRGLADWIEPISFSGSCDTNQQVEWTWSGGFWRESPRKMDALDRPYCFPLLTETDPNNYGGKGCWRFFMLKDYVMRPEANPIYRRHYGGANPMTNGADWLFGDGHVQWYSAHSAGTDLMCCIDMGVFTSSVVRNRDSIEAYCAASQ